MNFYFFKLCWKNIWRNRRRTLLTVNAIGFGVMSLVGIHNYYDAFHEQVIHNVIRYHSGHLILSAPGYQANNAPNLFIRNADQLGTFLQREPAIRYYSPRILVPGMISSSQGSANIVFSGIDPQREKSVTRFAASTIRGRYFAASGNKSIFVGVGLARLLKLRIGSKVVALTQGVDGSIGNELFYVEGIFETQSDIDKSLAFIRLDAARSLLSLPAQTVHQIAVVLHSESDLPREQARLKAAFVRAKIDCLSWKDVQRPLMAMIELNKSANRLLMMIILFIAALGIANSILMSILERTREFGVMMAIGTTKAEVIRMVMVETLLLSAVGVVLGNLFGVLLTLYFHRVGFDLRWLTSQRIVIEGTIIQTITYPTVQWANSLSVTSVILFLSVIVSIIPIRHISRLNTVKALRAI